MNYVNIIQLFNQFAVKHKMVKRFRSDNLSQLPDFTNEKESFPILYVVPINNIKKNYGNGYRSTQYIFNVYCAVPIIQLDTNENNNILLNQTNLNLQLTSQILNDMFASMYDLDEFDVLYDLMTYPISNYGNSSLQGMYTNITIEVPDNSICDIAMDCRLSLNKFGFTGYVNGEYIVDQYLDDSTCIPFSGSGNNCGTIIDIINEDVTIDFTEFNTVTLYADYQGLKIMSIKDVLHSPIITILVNGIPYVFGTEMNLGDKVDISVDIASVIQLKTKR